MLKPHLSSCKILACMTHMRWQKTRKKFLFHTVCTSQNLSLLSQSNIFLLDRWNTETSQQSQNSILLDMGHSSHPQQVLGLTDKYLQRMWCRMVPDHLNSGYCSCPQGTIQPKEVVQRCPIESHRRPQQEQNYLRKRGLQVQYHCLAHR